MLTYLNRLVPGDTCMLEHIDVSAALESRLRNFGFVSGTKILCRYRSPDGNVTALELRGTVLALRTADLRHIRVCAL